MQTLPYSNVVMHIVFILCRCPCNMSKTSASVSSGVPNTEMKDESTRPQVFMFSNKTCIFMMFMPD